MALHHGSKIVNDGLVLCLDAANIKSFRGEPTTNLFNISKVSRTLDFAQATGILTYGTSTIIDDEYAEYIIKNGAVSAGYESYRLCVTSIAGSTYTISFFIKLISGDINAIGIQFGGGSSTLSPKYYIGNNIYYYEYSATIGGTSLCVGIGFVGANNVSCYVYKPQVEQKDHATAFVNNTRGTTVATGGGWKDLSGSGNNGELFNYPTYDSANLGSLVFNGSNQYVSCGNFGTFYTTGTIDFWINASVMASYNNPFTTTFQGGNVGIRFEEDATGSFGVVIGNDAGTYNGYSYISSGMAINTWYNILLTWSTSSNSIIGYLNGSQVFNTTHTYWATIMPSVTLGYGFGSNRFWNGKMSNIKIYNKILSPSEILQNFNSNKGRYFTLGSKNNPANSALDIKASISTATDGVYWINLPTVGATQVYCIMNSAYDGGGWMLMMKATRGTTFNYDANYWTTNNTLNPTDLTLNDADAKYNVMNYYLSKDMMARFPDISQGGSIAGVGAWTWLQNNFYNQTQIVPITFFNNTNSLYISDAKMYNGWASGVFSSQDGYRWYGYNYNINSAKVRWGFGWNNEADPYSNDVSGGIGMGAFGSYSAGDTISCCADTTGINRSARVEIYVR